MKTVLASPVLAAVIVSAAMVWAACIVSNTTIRLAADQRVGVDSGITIQAPDGFHVDVLGEVRIPNELSIDANVTTEAKDR